MNQKRTKMGHMANPRWMLMFLIVFFLTVSISVAGDSMGEILQFQPPVRFDSGEEDIVGAVMRHFDVVHVIDLITSDKNRIVVGDRSYNIAPGVRMTGLREGMYVGLKLNDKKEVVVVEQLSPLN